MNKHTPGPWFARNTGGAGWPGQRGWAIDYNEDQEQVTDFVYEEADARLIAAAPDLLEALESVSQEHDLLRWMKNIEMRRSQGSFGIAVADDSDAIGWQEQAEKLKVLVDRRESAIARARGEA